VSNRHTHIRPKKHQGWRVCLAKIRLENDPGSCSGSLIGLYPNPLMLYTSAQRAWSPPIDPQTVRHLAATLPDDPHLIEAAVNTTLVPYTVPWQTHGVPWYFPNAAEVLEQGQGDCQGRAVVLALARWLAADWPLPSYQTHAKPDTLVATGTTIPIGEGDEALGTPAPWQQ
jgi:hypothetical protein